LNENNSNRAIVPWYVDNLGAIILAEKNGVIKCRFRLKTLLICAKIDHSIGFQGKRHFFAEHWRKSPKLLIITLTPMKKNDGDTTGLPDLSLDNLPKLGKIYQMKTKCT
jgi:hypothetical protein